MSLLWLLDERLRDGFSVLSTLGLCYDTRLARVGEIFK